MRCREGRDGFTGLENGEWPSRRAIADLTTERHRLMPIGIRSWHALDASHPCAFPVHVVVDVGMSSSCSGMGHVCRCPDQATGPRYAACLRPPCLRWRGVICLPSMPGGDGPNQKAPALGRGLRSLATHRREEVKRRPRRSRPAVRAKVPVPVGAKINSRNRFHVDCVTSCANWPFYRANRTFGGCG